MKIKYKDYDINLADPKHAEIKKAKDKADNVMEWAVMFHQGSLAIVIVSIGVAIFGSTAQWLFFLIFWLVLLIISQVLQSVAKAILYTAIEKAIKDEE